VGTPKGEQQSFDTPLTTVLPRKLNIGVNDDPVSYMTRRGSTSSNSDRLQEISAELASLFQQQIELTRREALVGLTPAECAEYDKIVEGIRESYSELAKIRSGS
jgi:hypothetical protein